MGWVSEHLLTPYAVLESLWLGQHALPLGLPGADGWLYCSYAFIDCSHEDGPGVKIPY